MSRLLETDRCPHCGEELEAPVPRTCPECGGSLQQRYLKSGCLTSRPLLLLLGIGALWMLRSLHRIDLA